MRSAVPLVGAHAGVNATKSSMNIEATMVSYYADKAKVYERIYHKPERQDELRRLRGSVERAAGSSR